MFFNAPGKPTQLKKAVYLSASVVLGLLLSFFAHALIEINYLHRVSSQGQVAPFYGGCALSPELQAALWVLGALGGFFLGRFWWRKIYIEKVWMKNRKK
jgi:H+/Cl- antiporter ClcA